MSNFRKRLVTSAAAVTAVIGVSFSASALEIKSSDVHPMGYPTTDAIQYMGELLNT